MGRWCSSTFLGGESDGDGEGEREAEGEGWA